MPLLGMEDRLGVGSSLWLCRMNARMFCEGMLISETLGLLEIFFVLGIFLGAEKMGTTSPACLGETSSLYGRDLGCSGAGGCCLTTGRCPRRRECTG